MAKSRTRSWRKRMREKVQHRKDKKRGRSSPWPSSKRTPSPRPLRASVSTLRQAPLEQVVGRDVFAKATAARDRAASTAGPRGYSTEELILHALLDAPRNELTIGVLQNDHADRGHDYSVSVYRETITRLRKGGIITISNGGKRGRPGPAAIVKRVKFN